MDSRPTAGGGLEEITLDLAGFSESLTVKPDREPISEPTPGTATLEDKQLSAVPLKSERFEDALPLLPGVVRGPDGLLNMNDACPDQSSLVVNGINMTDPVTGGFAVRLPLEAIERITVHSGASVAAFGNASGSVTDVVVRPGQDRLAVQVQNVIPRLRFTDNSVRGIDSFTPRMRVSGPIRERLRVVFRRRELPVRAIAGRRTASAGRERADRRKLRRAVADRLCDRRRSSPGRHPALVSERRRQRGHRHAASVRRDARHRAAGLERRGEHALRSVLSNGTALATSLASRQYNVDVEPKHGSTSHVTVGGVRSNYFNHFDRNSRRDDLKFDPFRYLQNGTGSHLVKAGGQLAHTTYDGIDASLPVMILRADGTPNQRIDFLGDPGVGAENWEVAAFADDEWNAGERVTFRLGLRYSHEGIAEDHTLASRFDAAVRPFADGRTVIKAGAGRIYDKLPLSADDLRRRQSRRVSNLDALGRGHPLSHAGCRGSHRRPAHAWRDGVQRGSRSPDHIDLDGTRQLSPRPGFRTARCESALLRRQP